MTGSGTRCGTRDSMWNLVHGAQTSSTVVACIPEENKKSADWIPFAPR